MIALALDPELVAALRAFWLGGLQWVLDLWTMELGSYGWRQ